MNKTTRIVLLFAVVFLLVGSLIADEEVKQYKPDKEDGCKNCAHNEGCCNDWNNNNGKPTCYSKLTHQCNGGYRLCPKNHLSCGKDCYNPREYYCYEHRLVPISDSKCKHHHKDRGGCGNKLCCHTERDDPCYNPNLQKCTPHGLIYKCFGYWANDKEVCSGHGECKGYDECKCDHGFSGKKCEQYPQCRCKKDGQKCCWDLNRHHGRAICYDEKTQVCYDGKHLCKKGEKTCRKECYDEKKYDCVHGKVVKKEDKKDDDKQEKDKKDDDNYKYEDDDNANL